MAGGDGTKMMARSPVPRIFARTLLAFAAFAALAATGAVPPPELEVLLTKAGRYVAAHEADLAGLSAEETFLQKQFKQPHSGLLRVRAQHADFVLMGTPDDFRWAALRDVFEVDGKAVRERSPRLETLFLAGPTVDAALERAVPIAEAAAAHDLGAGARNFNIPTLALAFLHPENQGRFRFTRKGPDTVEGVPVWAVDYVEQRSPAFVRDAEGRDLYGQGTVWIDADDGKIVRTYFKVSDAAGLFQVELTVTFRYWSEGGLWVPREMRESRMFVPQAVDRTPTRRVDMNTTVSTGQGVAANPGFGRSVSTETATDSTGGLPTEYVETVAEYAGYHRFGEFKVVAPTAQAVSIDHDPVPCVAAGRRPRLRACFEPASEVARADVQFRAEGTRDWYAVEMQPEGGCHAALLPRPTAKSVEYFVDLLTRTAVAARTRRYTLRVGGTSGTCASAGEPASARTLTVLAADVKTPPAGFKDAGLVTAAAPPGLIATDAPGLGSIATSHSRTSRRVDNVIAGAVGVGLVGSGAWVKLHPGGGGATDPDDHDGDGFTPAQGDCNDSRRDVRPGGEFSFSVDGLAFSGAVSCSQPSRRQQVYRVTNSACQPLLVQALVYRRSSACGPTTVEELPLQATTVAPGERAVIRMGPPAGAAYPMCCTGPGCDTTSCRISEQYTVRTSAGERAVSGQFTVVPSACLSCEGSPAMAP
jgi:hypothetical protein